MLSILGMTSDLLCDNYEEEWKLCNMIRVRQCKPDPDSVVLTEALLQEFASKNPFYLSYNFSCSLSRHFIGDDLADELGLSRFNMLSLLRICYTGFSEHHVSLKGEFLFLSMDCINLESMP